MQKLLTTNKPSFADWKCENCGLSYPTTRPSIMGISKSNNSCTGCFGFLIHKDTGEIVSRPELKKRGKEYELELR